jgi:hypothetical protein
MSTETAKEDHALEYNSNPFTLSFRGFGLLVDYAKGVFITMLVFGFLGFLSNIPSYFPSSNSDLNDSSLSSIETSDTNTIDSTDAVVIGGIIAVIAGVAVVFLVVGVVISAAYKGFVAAGTIAATNRKRITVGEAFSEMGTRFGVLFKAEIITTLKIIGGYLLFIVPGIRAQLRYQSTPFIIMSEKELSAGASIAKSKELYRNHLLEAFGIATVGALIPFIGNSLLASGMALSVQQLTAYNQQGKATPKTHWLNYIGLIFVGLIIVSLVSILMLFAALA